ncbi:unnamed protein product, partial [marine sediment metagenome]
MLWIIATSAECPADPQARIDMETFAAVRIEQ